MNWSDNDLEDPFARVGGIDSNDFAGKGPDGDRWPADELDSGPTFELQSDWVSDVDQGCIDATDGHFHGEVFGFGDDFKEFVPFFDRVGTYLAPDGLDAPAAWAGDFESIVFPLFGEFTVEFFCGVVHFGGRFVEVVLFLENLLVDFVSFSFEVSFFGV